MTKLIFVNLPVTELDRSIRFYEALGANRNARFSDAAAACIVVSDTIHVMLLTHERFRQFTTRRIVDAQDSAQVLLALSQDSREAVDEAVQNATRAGGVADPNPSQDYGFMYGRSYADPDGHIWEVVWMDLAQAEAAAAR